MPVQPSVDVRAGGTTHGARIELVEVSKRYPGQAEPAVNDFSMVIPAGELVVFVGPSGCGKTTTMKMINRIIEPTSGQILLDGEDVLSLDPDRLRRRIGYVIQQIGLFPHMTIAENIAIVPRLLGWDKARTGQRVDELLDVVGLEPGRFRGRFPRQLSGGQQQRVGVARALAADPPVMLMDEPFGATDPITRDKLQNEFLRLQQQLRKTIIFVTHDFEEALKLGDRIAVLGEGSRIHQYDTPDAILAAPADDYVAEFVGHSAAIKRLALKSVADLQLSTAATSPDLPSVSADATLREALDAMVGSAATEVLVRRADGTVAGTADYAAVCRALAARPGAVS
ncbi:MAG TPA: ABC transporter ATP-binding protein [Motilibacteraceae bacterium]|nr:ABC transporter ATP-binding protein [Motilibacteraceae bacterium]